MRCSVALLRRNETGGSMSSSKPRAHSRSPSAMSSLLSDTSHVSPSKRTIAVTPSESIPSSIETSPHVICPPILRSVVTSTSITSSPGKPSRGIHSRAASMVTLSTTSDGSLLPPTPLLPSNEAITRLHVQTDTSPAIHISDDIEVSVENASRENSPTKASSRNRSIVSVASSPKRSNSISIARPGHGRKISNIANTVLISPNRRKSTANAHSIKWENGLDTLSPYPDRYNDFFFSFFSSTRDHLT